MFRAARLFLQAAPALTYVEGNRGEIIPKILDFFEVDAKEKGLVMPKYEKFPFAFDVKTPDDRIAGSICGYSLWNEVHVDMLCASPDVRVPGTGKVLMRAMEDLAREQGKDHIDLDTYSWQARPFYEKLGYKTFATQEDYPKGHNRFFMEKAWKLGEAYDPTPFELKGENKAAGSLKVAAAEPKEVERRLDRWLDDNTQSRKIPGVDHYVKKEYAFEAHLPDGTPVAFCCFETLWKDLHISFLACRPTRKNQGIGSRVLQHLVDIGREKGCVRMSLETMSWQAQPFYEKNGFTVFGAQENIALEGATRIHLQRPV